MERSRQGELRVVLGRHARLRPAATTRDEMGHDSYIQCPIIVGDTYVTVLDRLERQVPGRKGLAFENAVFLYVISSVGVGWIYESSTKKTSDETA